MNVLARIWSAGVRRLWHWRNRSRFVAPAGDRNIRLFVDVSAIIRHDAQTGIQRVVRAVWMELKNRSGVTFEVVPIFAGPTHGYCIAPIDFSPGCKVPAQRYCASVAAGDVFLALDLAAHLLPLHQTQLRAWRRAGVGINFVVYDLLPMLRPDWFKRRTVRNFRRWHDILSTDADQAICISAKVAHELRDSLGTDGPSIVQMRLGADIAGSLPSRGLSPELAKLIERMRVRPTVLMVGTIEPRKGYDAALAAFDYLWNNVGRGAPDLVIVGRKGWKTEALQSRIRTHPAHSRRLHWLTGVSDEGLCRLYEVCHGVLVASRAEGFGLPLVEASMYGCSVLARDLPVFREQGLPNVWFFDDDRPKPLGRRVMELINRKAPADAAETRLPTWSECVDGLLAHLDIAEEANASSPKQLRHAS